MPLLPRPPAVKLAPSQQRTRRAANPALFPAEVWGAATAPPATRWAARVTPWDATGVVNSVAWSPELGIFVAVGADDLAAPTAQVLTSPDGVNWTPQALPWGAAAGAEGLSVAWSSGLLMFVASGSDGTILQTSLDGVTWTPRASSFDGFAGAGPGSTIAWSPTLAKWVALGFTATPHQMIQTSTNGVTWTLQAIPTDLDIALTVTWAPAPISQFVLGATTSTPPYKVIWLSPDGITWTPQTTPWDGLGGTVNDVKWSTLLSLLVATGLEPSPQTAVVMTSPDGIVWTSQTTPIDNPVADVGNDFGSGVLDVGDRVLLFVTAPDGGAAAGSAVLATTDGVTWTVEVNPFDTGNIASVAYTGAWSPTLLRGVVSGFPAPSGSFLLATVQGPGQIPNQGGGGGRFFHGYDWRFIFVNIPTPESGPPQPGGITTTWCEGLLTNRSIVLTLDQASVIEAAVWPDDPRVNALFGDDATHETPLVAPNNRIIYAFRREGGTPPWVIRAAGILMNLEDQGDPDIPLSHLTAYDPWKYLEGRPCVNAAGTLPGQYGMTWFTTRGDQIACQLLHNTITMPTANGGGFCFIDAGIPFGGTGFYGGNIGSPESETQAINFEVQSGTMVADAWTQLCETGTMDIVLTPIYDPVNRPGYTHELNIYPLAGMEQPNAVFSWDQFQRSVAGWDAMHDGTPGNFVNVVEYLVGQAGLPVLPQINDELRRLYLGYWSQQFFPDQNVSTGDAVLAMAEQALRLGKQGKRTTTLNVTPERSPIAFLDYTVGDRVPLYTSNRLRVARTGYQRVQAIPITVTDDGTEQIGALLCSPDWAVPIEPEMFSATAGPLGSQTNTTPPRTMSRLGRPLP